MPALLRHRFTFNTRCHSSVSTSQEVIAKRRKHNILLPVLRLYPDLLEYLFLMTAELEADKVLRERTIISCSQTCHTWRDVALSIKSLWSRMVDFEHNFRRWNDELLQRSHPYSIDIGPRAYVLRERGIISVELDYLVRIRIYRIAFDKSSWNTLVSKLQQPAPCIEYLNISQDQPSQSFIIPASLFAGHAPQFRRLEMTQCLIDFQAPVVSSLTILSVLNLNAKTAPTPVEWLNHLSRMPSLTKLCLEGAMWSRDQSVMSAVNHGCGDINKVQLPFLVDVHLNGSLRDISIFLDGLIFPYACNMTLACSETQAGPHLQRVQSIFLRRLEYAHDLQPDVCPLLIYASGPALFIWNESNIHDPSLDNTMKSAPNLYLDLNTADFGCWETLLTPVLAAFGDAFSRLTSLELQIPSMHQALLPVLARADRIKTLTNISPTMTKEFLEKLQTTHCSSSILLPDLHTILFTRDSLMCGVLYRAFEKFLKWRSSMRHPMKKIIFRRCMVLDETVTGLERLGIEVDWNSDGMRWQSL
ncbi:hypothetical protein B0H34DRAFT_126250 [Crassisporium funariophilum]|nr:hypothetical protein B0H34DRAFT_126250 [Crassisporium funariophilum]